MWVLVLIVFIALVVAITILQKAGGGNFPWIQFYAKGRESGFNFSEVNLLRKVAVENRLENPTSLFWSIRQLDRSIRGTIVRLRGLGTLDNDDSAKFLSKLFDFRRRVELNLPKYKIGLKSSRKIVNHQRIRITLPGVGVYESSVVENLRRYMAVSYPEGPVLPPGFSWKGQKINIYFWRADDAGYVFESKVLEDFSEQEYPLLHIGHSDNLIRSQKRQSIRVEVNKPAALYALKSIAMANENEETGRGLKCRLVDISSDGAAVLIGGRAKVGLAVKLQFPIGTSLVRMCGTVRGVSFNPKKNQSTLHIQAVPLSPRQRNVVLSFVYNLFNEREAPNGTRTPVSKY
jgi:c-di-GMP-binding flagellar brake protein YcgR